MKSALCFDEICAAIPESTADLLSRVVRRAARRGIVVHLVGGPVRDLLLDRPLDDVDLMIDGDAETLAEAVARGRGGEDLRVVAHDRFGTVRIESADAKLDLARLRHETYAHPGALPSVTPGSIEQDAKRRDFSVNALSCPLDARESARPQRVFDAVGGLEDLASRRLRVLHPASFHDDPTRAWRAARLASRLDFSLDRGSRAALRGALRDGAFGAVSGERYRRELQLTFAEARHGVHAGHVLRRLADWHVLPALEPGLTLGRDRMAPLRRLSRAIEQPDWPAPRWQGWVAGLSIWLAPFPAALRRRTLERFSIRGERAARIVRFGRDAERALAALSRARGRGAVDALLAPLPEESVQALYALAQVAVRRRILRWGAEDRRRRSPVAGDELVAIGLSGPDVGRALARIRSGFLDGEVANREEALALAEEMARRSARRTGGARGRSSTRGVASKGKVTDTSRRRDRASGGGGRQPRGQRKRRSSSVSSAAGSRPVSASGSKADSGSHSDSPSSESSRSSKRGAPAPAESERTDSSSTSEARDARRPADKNEALDATASPPPHADSPQAPRTD